MTIHSSKHQKKYKHNFLANTKTGKLTMREMKLPRATSKFFKGGGLREPAKFGIYDAEWWDGVKQNLYWKSTNEFNYPMLLYVDMYRKIYNSSDKNYVVHEVLKFQRALTNNLEEVVGWKDKKTFISDSILGLPLINVTSKWLLDISKGEIR